MFGFIVSKREDEGLGFPDVLLSIEIANQGGNADLFCLLFVLKMINHPTSEACKLSYRVISSGSEWPSGPSDHRRPTTTGIFEQLDKQQKDCRAARTI